MEIARTCIIIGAGPAGLTAACELLDKTDIRPVVLESSGTVGGLSRTVEYRGNRIDIGGHRFFSRSARVMSWWLGMLPLQGALSPDDRLPAWLPPSAAAAGGPDPDATDAVMLLRRRRSRIYHRGRFFDYPVTFGAETVSMLGWRRTARIGLSYLHARLFRIREEKSLEDFFINRFGRELYRTFFRDYTEKVWGVPCERIPPEWGSQRVRGLSISKAVGHAARNRLAGRRGHPRGRTEASLIDRFLYPKLGPGQLWEEAARRISVRGGEILLHRQVSGLRREGDRIAEVEVRNRLTGETTTMAADLFLSSMPVRDLVLSISPEAPPDVRSIAEGLSYRNLIVVGLLLRRLAIGAGTENSGPGRPVPDTWIYIQEAGIRMGRIQVFNNWSPYMVRDPGTVWLGLEYFCDGEDPIWNLPDPEIVAMATEELERIGFARGSDVLDGTVIRAPRAYPGYFGSYAGFPVVRRYLDGIDNLYPIGRNGMHRYNNMDHAMLTAMTAVDNIAAGDRRKENIWTVNTESDHHESPGESSSPGGGSPG